MEAIPLPDESVDVVISNGVINLSPRKSRAFAEITRVLRPGGRICVSDLVVNDDLPPEVLSSGPAWAGCIAGALSERIFCRKLDRAGLVDVEVSERSMITLDDVAVYPLFTPDVLSLMRRILPDDTRQHIATSVIVRARKPAVPIPKAPAGSPCTSTQVQRLDEVAAVESGGVTVRPLKKVDEVELKVLEIEPGHTLPVPRPQSPPQRHRHHRLRHTAADRAATPARAQRRVHGRAQRAPRPGERRPGIAAAGVHGLLRRHGELTLASGIYCICAERQFR